jgi:hypothetical protein
MEWTFNNDCQTWTRCSVGFQKVFRPLGIYLMRQGHDLGYASGFFENDHVMGIETYGSMVFS